MTIGKKQIEDMLEQGYTTQGGNEGFIINAKKAKKIKEPEKEEEQKEEVESGYKIISPIKCQLIEPTSGAPSTFDMITER